MHCLRSPFFETRFIMKNKQPVWLKVLLIVLILAFVAVVGYILLREYQYGVSEDYYNSLRNLSKGAWHA